MAAACLTASIPSLVSSPAAHVALKSSSRVRSHVTAALASHSFRGVSLLGFSQAQGLAGAGAFRRQCQKSLSQQGAPQVRGASVMAMAGHEVLPGLPIDLRGKRAFIAGVADDQGYGWAITKALAAAGAEVILGTWVPALNIFETSLRRGKFDESRRLPDGSMMEIKKVYPLDAVFDTPDDVPEEIRSNKRYAGTAGYTVSETAEKVKADFGTVDIIVHSLANGPEVQKPLLETSRRGYLAAMSASSYSFISLVQRFGPIMNPGGAAICLTYIASERVIPGYGGGMSSAKAALESEVKVLAWEAGRKYGVRVNTISAGPLRSRAAKAIGFIDDMINYSIANSPLPKELDADEVGLTAAFLCSPLASAITGVLLYVDNGLHAMGVAVDSPAVSSATKAAEPAPVTAKA